MHIRKITLSNFKNIKELRLEFSPKINCISGNKGEGKTNLLDAVHYLSMLKSYFSPIDRYAFMHGTDETFMSAAYRLDDGTEDKVTLYMSLAGEKKAKRNDKAYQNISDHIGRYPVVMVSPYDTSLINGSSEERRRFMNMVLSQTDREYIRHLQIYNHVLLQRNKVLKTYGNMAGDLLDAFSEQLAAHAGYIYGKRAMLCSLLQAKVAEYYSVISSEKENAEIRYRSDLENGNLAEILSQNADRDLMLKYTSSGVHKDDLSLMLSGYPIQKFGSQGQQKTFLVALKMAQYSIMKDINSGISPMLLLDDVFDKLDMDRVSELLKMVAGSSFGQIFITDSNKVRMDKVISSITDEHYDFIMESGQCRRI